MKIFTLLLIFVIIKHSVGVENKPVFIEDDKKTQPVSAILFIKQNNDIFIPINKAKISLDAEEKLFFTCPNLSHSELDESTPSLAELVKPDYSYLAYHCENDYQPEIRWRRECGKVTFDVNGKIANINEKEQTKRDFYPDLFVFAACLDESSAEISYVAYKIIPYSSKSVEPKPINYYTFDYDTIPEDITKPYEMGPLQYQDIQDFDKTIEDRIIPQRLIPKFNISEEFSKSITDHSYNYKPQWLSMAKHWDNINRFVAKIGKKLDLLVFAGTYGTLHKQNKLLTLKSEIWESVLPIPSHWWILIKQENTLKGIIIGMHNLPKTRKKGKLNTADKLCDQDQCWMYGWKDIIDDHNSRYVFCCPVSLDLSEKLILESIELQVLNLEGENQEFRETNKIKVNSLLNELENITEAANLHVISKRDSFSTTPRLSKSLPASPTRYTDNDDSQGILRRWFSEKIRKKFRN